VASAVRDAMPQDYDRSDIAGIFEGIDRALPAYGNQGWSAMEQQIRTSKHISPERGGLMAAAMRDIPFQPGPGKVDMQTLEAQNRRLTRQAAGSPAAAQVAATSRALKDGLISPDSAVGRMLEEDAGQLASMQPHQWVESMGAAGMDSQVAAIMLNQPHDDITPAQAQAIRGRQGQIDVQPEFQAMEQGFANLGKGRESVMRGERGRIVKARGYNSLAHYNQLQGSHMQNIPKVMGRARSLGQQESATSHMGQSGPVARMVDATKAGPTPTSLTKAFFNVIPTGSTKAAAHQTTIAVDLDGTLAKSGPFDPKKIADPRPGAKDAMEKLKAKGCKIIINTVRGTDKLVADWLKKHEIPYDHINMNPDQPDGASDKPLADLYIDDRGVDARPSWRKIIEKVSPRIDRMRKEGAEATAPGDDPFWDSPPNKDGRHCPGCNRLFKEVEPLDGVDMCEVCERYGPPKEKTATVRQPMGIPDKTDFGDTGQLPLEMVDLIVQRHRARKAG
jgi:hypothetical protein